MVSAIYSHSGAYAFRSHVDKLNAKSPGIGIGSSIGARNPGTFPPMVVPATTVPTAEFVPSAAAVPSDAVSSLVNFPSDLSNATGPSLTPTSAYAHSSIHGTFPHPQPDPGLTQFPDSTQSPMTFTGDANIPQFNINATFTILNVMEANVKSYPKSNNIIFIRQKKQPHAGNFVRGGSTTTN